MDHEEELSRRVYYDWLLRTVLIECRTTYWAAKIIGADHVEVLMDFYEALHWIKSEKNKK